MARHAGREITEQRRHRQQGDKGGGHHPGKMLHAAFDGHLVPHRTENVVAAQQAEKIEKRPGHRHDLVGLRPGHG